jgi:hypothetical protein
MDEEVEIILQQDNVEVTEPLVADYILPTASQNTLGGVKVGDNLSIDSSGHLSVPVASASNLGIVKVGTGLTIDDEGVLSSDGGYVLPQATKNTLGGVYVDDLLDTDSLNPVQNAVVSLELDSISSDVDDLDTTVSGMSTTVGNLSGTVSSLSGSVTSLGDTVTTQGNTINNISGTVSNMSSDVTNLQTAVENLQLGLGETSQHVGELMVEVDDTIPYSQLTEGIWTSGDITVSRRGVLGFIICNLEGSLTIPANDSVVLLDTLTSMAVATAGVMTDGSNIIETQVNTSGEFLIVNNSSSSITLTRIVGSTPIIISSDNES